MCAVSVSLGRRLGSRRGWLELSSGASHATCSHVRSFGTWCNPRTYIGNGNKESSNHSSLPGSPLYQAHSLLLVYPRATVPARHPPPANHELHRCFCMHATRPRVSVIILSQDSQPQHQHRAPCKPSAIASPPQVCEVLLHIPPILTHPEI
jgi:hypothetical protein